MRASKGFPYADRLSRARARARQVRSTENRFQRPPLLPLVWPWFVGVKRETSASANTWVLNPKPGVSGVRLRRTDCHVCPSTPTSHVRRLRTTSTLDGGYQFAEGWPRTDSQPSKPDVHRARDRFDLVALLSLLLWNIIPPGKTPCRHVTAAMLILDSNTVITAAKEPGELDAFREACSGLNTAAQRLIREALEAVALDRREGGANRFFALKELQFNHGSALRPEHLIRMLELAAPLTEPEAPERRRFAESLCRPLSECAPILT